MRLLTLCAVFLLAAPALADGPTDNIPEKVRPVPPKGKEVPEAERKALESELAKLSEKIAAIEASKNPKILRYLPDVRIFHKAVDWALKYDEIFDLKEIAKAHDLSKEGMKRASALLETGKAPWMQESGLVALGYVSKIDGSTQPYGLIVPESWQPKGPFRHRLDLWFHGRGETLSELNFVADRMRNPGEFTPEDTFVLHPYGRFCNAAKFAGEIDAFEALDDVKSRYKIDENRISVRGFSMGGASAWHFAVHFPDKWFAANPGAGFSETPRFLKVFQNEEVKPTWYEKKLWQMYDCTDWATNLASCPTIAYSGELDPQKQAADVMAKALEDTVGIPLTHIIGPKTKHAYHRASAAEVERRMKLLEIGATASPATLDFTTYTLRYPRMGNIRIDGLEEHWKQAFISLEPGAENGNYTARTRNITAFTLNAPAGSGSIRAGVQCKLTIEPGSVVIDLPSMASDGSWFFQIHREGNSWKLGPLPENGVRKRPGLQGPIDDAFLDSFTFVRPTGTSKNEKVTAWVKSEGDRAVRRWRTQMRGDARVRDDSAVTDADIAGSNLVLWGDPESNAVLKKIADKLPIRWDGDQIKVGDRTYSAADHVPILIFPNPLNPEKYVVLNSGFTYREYDDLNNARQVPKLPDWAIVDVRTPPSSRFPGKVVDADFFDEAWKLKKKD